MYSLEEVCAQSTQQLAKLGLCYTWHTSGDSNWLGLGISNIDALGYVFLPDGLPDRIDLLADPGELDDQIYQPFEPREIGLGPSHFGN